LADCTKSMSFIYRFDMKKEFFYFDRLPVETQGSIEAKIVNVIYESFVIPGDHDYLTARLLAQKGLYRAFYWAAAQTLEKYLKAFLVFNGYSVEHRNHFIKSLLDDAIKIDSNISTIDISPHKNLKFPDENIDLFKNLTLEKFIEDIQNHGDVDNRYNAFGIDFCSMHLFSLDSFTYNLRKLIGVPAIENSFENTNEDWLQILEANNPWLAKGDSGIEIKPQSSAIPLTYSCSVTTLDYLVEHIDKNNNSMVLSWLNKKMKLPNEVKKKLKAIGVDR